VRSLFALLSMSDTQHPLGAAWYGRQRDGGISKFSIGTANTPLLNVITSFTLTGTGVYFESYCSHRGFGDSVCP
jgi:hypothetical protein